MQLALDDIEMPIPSTREASAGGVFQAWRSTTRSGADQREDTAYARGRLVVVMGGNAPDPRVMEIYQTAVEMADRISARRASANTFFLTVQTAFIAVLGVATPTLESAPWWMSLVVSVAGLTLSASWWLQLRSYRALNAAKFSVITKIEAEHMPIKAFSEEWNYLKQDPVRRWRRRYAELGTVERVVPVVFAVLYAVLFVGRMA